MQTLYMASPYIWTAQVLGLRDPFCFKSISSPLYNHDIRYALELNQSSLIIILPYVHSCKVNICVYTGDLRPCRGGCSPGCPSATRPVPGPNPEAGGWCQPWGLSIPVSIFAHHDISEQLQNTFNSSLFAKTVFLFSLAVFIVRFGWFNIKQISKAYKVTKRICSLIWKVNMFLLSTVSTLIRRTTKSNGINICCSDYFNQNRIHVGKEAVIRRC